MKKLLLFLVSVFTIASCTVVTTPTYDYPSYCYVTYYTIPTSVEFIDASNDSKFYIDFEYEYHMGGEYAELNNDTTYDSYVPTHEQAFAYPLDYINITCDEDYDSEHSAGVSLNDIAWFSGLSFYNYINNGYNINSGIIQLWELLDSVNSADHSLLMSGWCPFWITFGSYPDDLTKEYNFNIEVKIGDAILSGTLVKSFNMYE